MGQKDLTQKTLESYPDVFADCVNALLYRGNPYLQAENLLPAPTETTYPDNADELHNQFQDVSKYEMQDGNIKTQYTIENQSEPDRKMVLRKFGYEGARYRAQYQGDELYPIIDIVLYWGKRHWNYPRKLKRLIGKHLSAEELRYVDDIHLHIFEMAHLPAEVRRIFKSDMRIIVDYLAEGRNYIPTDQKILHVEALLRTLRALTNDHRFEHVLLQLTESEKKGDFRMCELLDKYWNGGVAAGKAEGKAEESIHNIRSMYKHKLPAETIAELISQSLEYINRIITLFTQYPEEDDLSIAKRLLAE